MLVYPDGRTLGTIGGGCVEADILRSALLMIREDGKENQKLCQVDMLNTDAEEEGMVCGGTVEVLLEIV